MKEWNFLSLRPFPWVMSLGTHLGFILGILWLGHSRVMDLTMVTLDFSPSKTVAPVQAPIEDIWQKPILLKNLPLPKFKLKPKPTPPVPQTVQVGDQGPVRSLAEVSQMPHFKIQIKPIYPDSAKHSGIEGVVVLQVEINALGEVTNIEVLQSLGYGCDEAASDAMRKSSFTPAYIGSDPVPVRIRIPYRFKING